ncbi:hypothetical protein evm_006608 [Chilo suppressalis]|nr:hypothetical protein evm_006608 [Chilo suppressalis]
MGRKKRNVVYRYFEINDDNTSTCLVPECRKKLKSTTSIGPTVAVSVGYLPTNMCLIDISQSRDLVPTTHTQIPTCVLFRPLELVCVRLAQSVATQCTQHGANLLKHLKHVHKDIHKEILEINNSRQDPDMATKSTTVSDTVLKECTNLVAIHGRPFSMVNDKAFQNLLSMVPGNTSTINAINIKENVRLLATKMRDELAFTLQDKIISLKIDIASLATRSFMGINCQYLMEGQLVLRNLGVIEIFQRHTSEHLKDLLVYNLQRFRIDTEINKKNYCITTDNGANMIKMTKLLNDMDNCVTLDRNTIEAGPSSSQCDDENADICNVSDSDFENSDFYFDVEEAYTAQLTNILRAQFTHITGENVEYKIGIVRCAAHALQLALHDACDDVAFSNLISSCREVVRRLRTPQFVRIIREHNKNVPKLDCSTRWHSVTDMVESLLSLRDICATDVRLHLPDSTWDTLTEILKSLTPAKQLTKKLQEEQLTVGDFYLAWMMCQFQLSKIKTRLSENIIESMKERQKLLFENDVFINGMFLDPRVNSVLTSVQQKKSKRKLNPTILNRF